MCLATGWSPVQGVLPTVCTIKKLKKRPRFKGPLRKKILLELLLNMFKLALTTRRPNTKQNNFIKNFLVFLITGSDTSPQFISYRSVQWMKISDLKLVSWATANGSQNWLGVRFSVWDVTRGSLSWKSTLWINRPLWPRGLFHELSSPAQTLGSWVRIPLEVGCLRLFCVCVVLCR
jgi:hypothetical protein